jgi:hypothetical protein
MDLGAPERLFYLEHFSQTVRGQQKIVVATTTSVVAASILSGRRTTHSWFKMPLRIMMMMGFVPSLNNQLLLIFEMLP